MIDKTHWFLLLLIILELLKDGALGSIRRSKRVISGNNVMTTNEIPYMAQLRRKYREEPVCGGTAITSLFVLSAAHCFWAFRGGSNSESGKVVSSTNPYGADGQAYEIAEIHNIWDDLSDYEFVLGTMNLNGEGGQSYKIERIYIPPKFNDDDTFDSDITVARLSCEIIFDSNVAPAKLPFRKEKYNVKAMIGGWGFNEIFQIPKNLQKLEVVNVESSECEKTYNVHVTSRSDSMCAHKNQNMGYGLCMGDGGGGLVSNNVVFGVASAKFSERCECAVEEYTLVWHHIEWILLVIDGEKPHDICVVKDMI